MKRILACMLCICLLTALAACGAKPAAPTETGSIPTTPSTQATTGPSEPEETSAPTVPSETEGTMAPTDPSETEGTSATTAPSETEGTTATTAPSETEGTVSPTEPTPPEQHFHPMHAVVMPFVQETVVDEDGTLIFTKAYQEFSLVFSGSNVGDVVSQDLHARMNAFLASAADIESYAKNDYTGQSGWAPYYVTVQYLPTRIDHNVLSLYGKNTSFSGETHPSSGTDSVNYDLATGNALTLGDILIAGYQGQDVADLICQALTDWSGELYSDYEDVLAGIFKKNSESITNWYFTGTGLAFHFSPSEIAPTFVGIVTGEIPYESLSGLLREQYFPTVSQGTGMLEAEEFIADDSERFSSIVEVKLHNGGKKILLYPDTAVTDLRIEQGAQLSDGSGYMTQTTVFCADRIDAGEAIVIEADLSDPTQPLQISYRSGNRIITASLVYDADGDSIILAYG